MWSFAVFAKICYWFLPWMGATQYVFGFWATLYKTAKKKILPTPPRSSLRSKVHKISSHTEHTTSKLTLWDILFVMSYNQSSFRRPSSSSNASPYDEVVEMFYCPICFEILDEATMVKQCGHEFCRGCIDTWLTTHGVCPVCREITSRNDIKPCHLMRLIISQLQPQRQQLSLDMEAMRNETRRRNEELKEIISRTMPLVRAIEATVEERYRYHHCDHYHYYHHYYYHYHF